MRRRILRAAVSAILVAYAAVAFAFSTGPPANRTNALPVAGRPAELVCTQCHTGSPLNDPAGKLEILDLPDRYEPNTSYPVRIKLAYSAHQPEDFPRWGFEITAISAQSGMSIGSWTVDPSLRIIPTANQTSWPNRWYVEHGGDPTSLHEGDPGPVEWQISWTAPPGDSGAIYFFAAGNAANGDGCSGCGGDHIFTTRDTVLSTATVGVPLPIVPALANMLGRPNPNPMNQCVDLPFAIARAGHIDLAVFDLQGRKVRSLARGWHDAGPGAGFWNGRREDGSAAPNGVYFVRLLAPGMDQPLVRRLTLAH